MDRELICLIVCFIVGIFLFYLLRSSCGCQVVEGNNDSSGVDGDGDELHRPIPEIKARQYIDNLREQEKAEEAQLRALSDSNRKIEDKYGNISEWNTSEITDMSRMFSGATSFNEDISGWDTSKVTTMNRMFLRAKSFNQNIGNWNTSKVTSMSFMFQEASAFNQDIGNWNTKNVTDMSYMFWGNSSFDKDIRGWDIGSLNRSGQRPMVNKYSPIDRAKLPEFIRDLKAGDFLPLSLRY